MDEIVKKTPVENLSEPQKWQILQNTVVETASPSCKPGSLWFPYAYDGYGEHITEDAGHFWIAYEYHKDWFGLIQKQLKKFIMDLTPYVDKYPHADTFKEKCEAFKQYCILLHKAREAAHQGAAKRDELLAKIAEWDFSLE